MVIDYKNVKKYIIYFYENENNENTYDIDEVQYISTELWIRTKYKVKNNVIINNIDTMTESWVGEEHLGKHYLFTSESYQECLDELGLILESKKYNL